MVKHTMAKFILTLLLAVCLIQGTSQSYYFPPLTGQEWETVSPDSLGWCTSYIDSLINYLDYNNTKAFIVLKDGKIAIEHYFGTFVRDSIWYWASAGKTLTAFLTGLAQEQGYLDIHDRTSKYLGNGWTSCIPEQEDQITVWNQLTMTTGLQDDVQDPYCTLDTCLTCIAGAGSRWAYHNAPYTLLESVVEAATGQDYNIFLNSQVKSRTGMTGLFLPSGYNNVYYSNARSMARFGLLVLNQSIWNGDTVMHDTAYFHDMVNTSQSLNLSYGYLWWLNGKSSFMLPQSQFVFPGAFFPDAPADMFSALGKNGQFLDIVPSMGLVVVRMGNLPENSGEIAALFNNGIWQYLDKIICNLSVPDHHSGSDCAIDIHPNPAHDQVAILMSGYQENYTVVVSDISGKNIFSGENPTTIRTSEWDKGVYIIQFRMKQEFRTFKLIKN
jgi:CubicO group peptidase (beta-lactamase class C family)